jgi:2-polyprenyl-6-methoxyphenol hydroxylase-like FAD-dependent oxidoreductase
MLQTSTDVLVVGAGPTGLALSVALQSAGVDHVVIDALAQGQNTSRAAVIHAHTLEALATIGVAAKLENEGNLLSQFVVRDRDRALLQIGFDELPSAYQGLLIVPQSVTEKILSDRLSALGGSIRRGTKAIALERDATGVNARVVTGGREQSIHARYVVGADGMHSIVREAAGIGFKGASYGESFLLADVRMHWPLEPTEVSLFFSAAGLVVVAPLPDRSFRIVATLEDAPEAASIQDIQKILDARGPARRPCKVESVGWSSRFRVHHRLADTYRNGPFLLMGDAAHVHSPAGGQGMNTGVIDAIALGGALSRVLGGAPELELDSYASTRRPAAEQVLSLAGRLTTMAVLRPLGLRMLRNGMLRVLNRLAPFKMRLALDLSGLSRRKLSGITPRDYKHVQPMGGNDKRQLGNVRKAA